MTKPRSAWTNGWSQTVVSLSGVTSGSYNSCFKPPKKWNVVARHKNCTGDNYYLIQDLRVYRCMPIRYLIKIMFHRRHRSLCIHHNSATCLIGPELSSSYSLWHNQAGSLTTFYDTTVPFWLCQASENRSCRHSRVIRRGRKDSCI